MNNQTIGQFLMVRKSHIRINGCFLVEEASFGLVKITLLETIYFESKSNSEAAYWAAQVGGRKTGSHSAVAANGTSFHTHASGITSLVLATEEQIEVLREQGAFEDEIRDYWLYVPEKDEAGCISSGTSPEAALQAAELMGWCPDDGDEIQAYPLGKGSTIINEAAHD